MSCSRSHNIAFNKALTSSPSILSLALYHCDPLGKRKIFVSYIIKNYQNAINKCNFGCAVFGLNMFYSNVYVHDKCFICCK